MKLPNLYVALEKTTRLNLANYFEGGNQAYTCSVVDANVASATVEGTTLIVKALATGSTKITITGADGKSQTAIIIVRKNASDKGWM